MNQIKLFFKTKDHEDPRAYVRIHTYAHACSRPACTCFMHVYIYTSMCVHVKVPEIMKDKFFCIKTWFGMNPTLSGSCSKPPFSNYIKPYTVSFQNTQKILKENIRFTRNSESKRFFTKYLQDNIFLIKAFYGLDVRVSSLLITFVFYCE